MSAPAVSTSSLPCTGTGTRAPGWWGMALVCVTEVSLFAYLLVAYFYLHGAAVAVSAHGGRNPELTLPLLLTVILVSSSVVLRWGERGMERGDSRRLLIALSVAIVLGVAFLGVQGVEYSRETHTPQTDAWWSTFFTITGIHGAHVLLGVLMLAFTWVRTLRGHFTAERRLAVQNAALYWHTVDAIWLAIVAALYLAPYAL